MDRSIDRTEKRARMFLAAAIIHVFERTGVHKELSHQELSFYISRLMNRTRQGLTVMEGHVPHINKADSLAKVVVTELQEKYGSMLKNMLPQQYLAVEDFVVLCLQKHAKKWFQKREKKNSHKWAVFFKGLVIIIVFFACYIVFITCMAMGLLVV
ncbi:hypothetical protein JOB18_011491 [Solea senegalensis]|uniref:Uncharacterized protein n=1 Tax=Solea senegalensis TaxID=28829 RepID=A0AAV6T4L9_SOLSE|nr:hypothetical protein JOB18_011491 [Solea senegalensis]